MPPLSSIPSTRISDLAIQQRLIGQLQSDQAALLRLQVQLATGRRLEIPSEDAPAALRAMDLQRLLERKAQIQTNLTSNQAYLNATDAAAASVAELAIEARSLALSAVDSGTTGTARQAIVTQLDSIISQIINLGNQEFRGRRLFAGSAATAAPYERVSGAVRYNGNEGSVQSYGDIGLVLETNVTGHDLLGGISTPVVGSVDLNPRLTSDTRLSDLRGGQGVHRGTIAVSDGGAPVLIDLSSAETIGDVARLLERNPPPGRQVTATVTNQGLRITLSGAGANLSITEVGDGTSAHELGIFNSAGVGNGPMIGEDLDPRVTKTTLLADILGTRATAAIRSADGRNDVLFEAKQRGDAFNDVTIVLVDGGLGTAGNETAVYDDSNPFAKTLTITIEDGVTTANQLIAAVEAQSPFHATLDPAELGNDGNGTIRATAVDPLATAVTAGGGGADFDQTGLRINQGGQAFDIDLSTARTVEDLLNSLNRSSASVLAEINADGTGVNVRSRLNGVDFSIGERGGATATQLGIRTFTAQTRLEDLRYGQGVQNNPGVDFQIRRKDGALIDIDLAGAQTIGDVLNLINGSPANPADAWQVTARLAANGNGIELVTSSLANVATFAVLANGSPAANQLGLVPDTLSVSAAAVVSGGTETITGRDANPMEGAGLIHALVRLREAVEANNVPEIERASGLLEEGLDQANFIRAELGARQQMFDALTDRVSVEQNELRRVLSIEIDVDLVQVISEFSARQASFQASLQLIGQVSQLSLLDFL